MKFDFQTIARAAEVAYANYKASKTVTDGTVDPKDTPTYWYAIAGYAQALREEVPEGPVTLCSICHQPYAGIGHNAEPIADERCCEKCNNGIVVPIRLLKLVGEKAKASSQHLKEDQQ